MQMSGQGEEMLVDEEGEVLRTYRCPAGVLTIGVGLTAGSGVVKPKPGMTITRQESRRMLREALRRNYEPRVERALGPVAQHVFDGATSFDWNTGAIHKASWVGKFKAGAIAVAGASFKSWNKAAGKVLNGLVGRRNREWTLIEFARYPDGAKPSRSPAADYAMELDLLGYKQPKLIDAVFAFQRDHKLTVDGIIGPATRAALARAKTKRLANKSAAGTGAGAAPIGAAGETAMRPEGTEVLDATTLAWAGGIGLAAAAIVFLLFLAWRYRGPLLVWLPEPVKDFFEASGIVLGRRVRT